MFVYALYILNCLSWMSLCLPMIWSVGQFTAYQLCLTLSRWHIHPYLSHQPTLTRLPTLLACAGCSIFIHAKKKKLSWRNINSHIQIFPGFQQRSVHGGLCLEVWGIYSIGVSSCYYWALVPRNKWSGNYIHLNIIDLISASSLYTTL